MKRLPVGTNSEAREQALQRLKKRRDFSARAVAYAVINAALWGACERVRWCTGRSC